MRFQAGCKPGPGRPAGSVSGRAQALRWLDRAIADNSLEDEFKAAVLEAFHQNPMKFFERFIMPLLPKDSRMQLDTGGEVRWQSLLKCQPLQPGDDEILREYTEGRDGKPLPTAPIK